MKTAFKNYLEFLWVKCLKKNSKKFQKIPKNSKNCGKLRFPTPAKMKTDKKKLDMSLKS